MQPKQPDFSHKNGDTVPRLRLWEIADFLVCPVIGQCMSLDEQRQVLKRTKVSAKKMTRHELHEILVSCANEENFLSTRVDTQLQRKFGKESDALLRLDRDDFMTRYRDAFKAGDYCAALWAAAIHPNLPPESRHEVFGEVHMAMHFSGEERMKMMRKINTLEKKIAAMDDRTRAAVGQRRILQKENDVLKRTVTGLETKVAAADREKAALASELSRARKQNNDSREQENPALEKQMDVLRRELAKTRRREAILNEETARLMTELEKQREAACHFRQETREVISRMTKLSTCNPDCPAFDLCKKRILIVGGISRMESLYRELIENSNGIFEYHDGYVKNGVKQLESRLKRADVVLCPVNCNSHGACTVVKNLAKKHRKTVHMLSNFSISAVSGVLHGGNTVQASLN